MKNGFSRISRTFLLANRTRNIGQMLHKSDRVQVIIIRLNKAISIITKGLLLWSLYDKMYTGYGDVYVYADPVD